MAPKSANKHTNHTSFIPKFLYFFVRIPTGTTSSRYLEGLKVDYAQQKKSLPLCVTVPYYNKTEYLSALAYYTHHDIFAPNLHLHDLLGKPSLSCFVCVISTLIGSASCLQP